MKFKLGIIALILGIFLSVSPTMISAKTEAVGIETKSTVGWKNVNGTWYYYNTSGVKQTGWLKEGNTWYYLKSNGAMATGWEKVNGTWYYLEPSGAMKTGWHKENGTWYYLKPSGAMATGWAKDGNTYYYFEPSGAMKTGWLKEGSTWYYLKPSGAMATGWAKDGDTYYYFEPSGAMKTGWLKEGSTWYYLKPSGAMATGWEKVNNVWYYFYNSGAMATNTVIDGWSIDGNGVAKQQQPTYTASTILNRTINELGWCKDSRGGVSYLAETGCNTASGGRAVEFNSHMGNNGIDAAIMIYSSNVSGVVSGVETIIRWMMPTQGQQLINKMHDPNYYGGTHTFDGRKVEVSIESYGIKLRIHGKY